MMQRRAEIAPGVGETRCPLDRAAIRQHRVVETFQRIQGIAEIAVGERKRGVELDRAAMTVGRVRVVLALVERRTEIA